MPMPTASISRRSRKGAASLVLLLGVAASAFAANGAAPDPKTLLKVDASLAPSGAGRGALTVRARLESGWHVNSHKPSEDYLIATEVKLDPADGVRFGRGRTTRRASRRSSLSPTRRCRSTQGEFVIEVPVEWNGDRRPRFPDRSSSRPATTRSAWRRRRSRSTPSPLRPRLRRLRGAAESRGRGGSLSRGAAPRGLDRGRRRLGRFRRPPERRGLPVCSCFSSGGASL